MSLLVWKDLPYMRQIVIVIVSIWIIAIEYLIISLYQPDILSASSLSERDTGQEYKYQILFKLRSCKNVELILYSDRLYKSVLAVSFKKFIKKNRKYYRIRYQDKAYIIPKEEVEVIEFTGSWNIGWW